MRGLFQNAPGGPEHQSADGQAKRRIEPERPRGMDDHRANQNGDVGKGVAEVVDKDAAEIEVAAAAHQGQGDAAIDGQRRNGSSNHPALDHRDRMSKPLPGLVGENQRHENQQERVGERRQDAGAVIAVSPVGIGGAAGPAQSNPGNRQRGDVGEIVDRVV